jgi:hypothetical protein
MFLHFDLKEVAAWQDERVRIMILGIDCLVDR